jgi:hypothetical protein
MGSSPILSNPFINKGFRLITWKRFLLPQNLAVWVFRGHDELYPAAMIPFARKTAAILMFFFIPSACARNKFFSSLPKTSMGCPSAGAWNECNQLKKA